MSVIVGATIFQALNKIMDECGAIPKDEKGAKLNYKFRGIDTFYKRLHPLFIRHKIVTVPQVLESSFVEVMAKSGSSGYRVSLRVKYTFYAPDGSFIEAITAGEAIDYGDKASNKAMSVAHKYALAQVFAIPTADEDPDGHGHELAGKRTPEDEFTESLKRLNAKISQRRVNNGGDMSNKSWAAKVSKDLLGRDKPETTEDVGLMMDGIDEYEPATGERLPF